jgi:hypothetical protein
MKTIWKFPLSLNTEQEIKLPREAVIISVQFQKGILFLWAKIDTESDTEERKVAIVVTGDDCDWCSRWNYIGTVQNNIYVWHIFIK